MLPGGARTVGAPAGRRVREVDVRRWLLALVEDTTRARERRGRKTVLQGVVGRSPRDGAGAMASLKSMPLLRLPDPHTSQRRLDSHAPAATRGRPRTRGNRPLKVKAAVLDALRTRRRAGVDPRTRMTTVMLLAPAVFAVRTVRTRGLLHGDRSDGHGRCRLAHTSGREGRANAARVRDALLLLLSPLPLLRCRCLLLYSIRLTAFALFCTKEGIDIFTVWRIQVVFVFGHGNEVVRYKIIVEVIASAMDSAHVEMSAEGREGERERCKGVWTVCEIEERAGAWTSERQMRRAKFVRLRCRMWT